MPNNEKQRSKDPHIGLRFGVEIEQVEVAGFNECSGITVETETFEYAEGGLNTYTHKLPVRTKYGNITLKRGMDQGQDLYTWYVKNMEGPVKRKPMSVILYDSLQQEVKRWNLHEAYPVKWTGPDLKADTGAIAVETVEIAYHGLLPTERDSRGISTR